MSRPWAVTASAIALFFFAAPARATEIAGAELRVQRDIAAEDCPDADELGRRVRALWMAPAAAASMHVQVRFRRSPAGYDADLLASGARSGTRRLSTSTATCKALAEAVTVALALLLDLEPLSETVRAPPARPTEVPGAGGQPERSRARFDVALGSSVGLGLGIFGPRTSGVGTVSLLGRRGHFAVEGLAFFVAPRSFDYDRGFVKVRLWGGGLSGCYRSRRVEEPGMAFRPCVGFRGGNLSGEGSRYDVNESAAQAWLALSASAHLEVPLSARFRFVSGLALSLPLARHEFRVQGRGAAFETWLLGGTLQLGLELTIW